jgi:hypothetical protein
VLFLLATFVLPSFDLKNIMVSTLASDYSSTKNGPIRQILRAKKVLNQQIL